MVTQATAALHHSFRSAPALHTALETQRRALTLLPDHRYFETQHTRHVPLSLREIE